MNMQVLVALRIGKGGNMYIHIQFTKPTRCILYTRAHTNPTIPDVRSQIFVAGLTEAPRKKNFICEY